MELVLLIAGVAAAIVVGIAWAIHSHALAEGADKVGVYTVYAALGLSALEAWNEWGNWTREYANPGGTFGPDLEYHANPRPAPPDLWRQLGHIGGQWLFEVVRDLVISGAAFGVMFLVLRSLKQSRSGRA